MNRTAGPIVIACCLLAPFALAQVVVEEKIVQSTVVDAVSHGHEDPASAPAIKPSPHILTKSKVALATFSPDGKVLLTVSDDGGQVHFWDATTGEEVNRIGVAVTHAIFSADGSRILTYGKDQVARVFDAKSGKALRRLEGAKEVRALAISADGAIAATAEVGNNAIRLWDTKTGQPTAALEGHSAPATMLAFTPDGRQLLSLAGDSGAAPPVPKPSGDPLRLWDLTTRKESRQIALPPQASGAFLSKDGKLALVAWPTSNKIYDLATGSEIPAPRTPDEHFPPGQTAGDRTTGLLRAPGSSSIVNVQTGDVIRVLAGPLEGMPVCNAFSSDGSRVILGMASPKSLRSPDTRGKVYVYEVATGRQLAAFDGHGREVQRVAFTPDGSRAISLDAARTLFLWAVPAGVAAK